LLYLVSIKKKTQDNPSGVFQFVPLQDFSHPWTDQMLFDKYRLSEEEQKYILSMIKPLL
jgi:site-specific DNA-methyltransferase (adenine-specific)